MLDPMEAFDQTQTEKGECSDTIFSHCWEVTDCSRSDRMACQAYTQRKNCYELDRVVCCSKHRDNCSTCWVHVALNKIPTQKIRVRISTQSMNVEGNIHLPLKMRLSDYMNRESTTFIALTEATVTPTTEPHAVAQNDLVVVNKDHIITAWPIDAQESQRLAA